MLVEKQNAVQPDDLIVRSVRYNTGLYRWLLARSRRYSRSVQRENTYLLERLRSRPDLLKILDEAPAETE
jgi:hypothetical protein